MHWIRKHQFSPQGLDFLRSQVATHTVIHEESESEVETCQILEPGGKTKENGIPGSNFLLKSIIY